MCLKKWFGKKQEVEVQVEQKSVDELINMLDALVDQLRLVHNESKKQDEKIKQLEEELKKEFAATCAAKDQIVELLNVQAGLERKLLDINKIIDGDK